MNNQTSHFVKLWTKSQRDLKRYIFTLVPRDADADDILQETSTLLWERFSEYDPERPFINWAMRYAYFQVLKWRQSHHNRLIFSDELLKLINDSIDEQAPFLELRRQALESCLIELDDTDRQTILQRYRNHGTVKKLAESSSQSIHQLYYQLEKLRNRLMKCINLRLQAEGWDHG